MNTSTAQRLKELRTDFESKTGSAFSHFYCPILFRDEPVDLCRAHIINEAFTGSSKKWTIQRADVDSFFGRNFEGEFVKLQYRGRYSPNEVVVDHDLSQKLSPKILFGGEVVPHFLPTGPVPSHFTKVGFEGRHGVVPLVLKIHPDEAVSKMNLGCEILIERDIRLPSLVSLLKAAHLTLFYLLGYSYAFSPGGWILGSSVLGEFFLRNRDVKKAQIHDLAMAHFKEFANMVRPMEVTNAAPPGTVEDGFMFICLTSSDAPWAVVTFMRTGDLLHAVLVPVIGHADSAARYASFLRGGGCDLRARRCQLRGGAFHAGPTEMLRWPKGNLV